MGLISTLKWLWDPRTEEQKTSQKGPLRRFTQHCIIHIIGVEETFEKYIVFEDKDFYDDWVFRVDIKHDIKNWLGARAEKGVKLNDVWYPPSMIERIELGELTVEEI
jgi:hypothetical protein